MSRHCRADILAGVAALLTLTGCVAYAPGDAYGPAYVGPAYVAPAYAAPAYAPGYGYYAAPPVDVVIGGGWHGGWHGGWGGGGGYWPHGR